MPASKRRIAHPVQEVPKMIRIARSVAAALALVVAAPTVALADAAPGTPPAADAAKADKAKGKGKAGKRGKDKNNFPMKATSFKDQVEKRIAKARTKIGDALERHNVPAAVRTEVMKDFDAGATAVRAAADRVGKDGEVTKTEADEVRGLAKDLKQKARDKYGLGGGKGKGKGKGKQAAKEASRS
jgi:hypothetical protein